MASQAAQAPAALLLAAGLGRRLGGVPKSALRIDGLSLFERLLPLAQRCGVHVVWQGVSDAPLACSQRLAVQEHRARQTPRLRRDLLLLVVADLPLLTDADIVPLLHAWHARPPAVQRLVTDLDTPEDLAALRRRLWPRSVDW